MSYRTRKSSLVIEGTKSLSTVAVANANSQISHLSLMFAEGSSGLTAG